MNLFEIEVASITVMIISTTEQSAIVTRLILRLNLFSTINPPSLLRNELPRVTPTELREGMAE